MRRARSVAIGCTLPALIVLAAVIHYYLPHSQDEQTARGLVENAYASMVNGGYDGAERRKFQLIEEKYGRVLSWRIAGQRRTPIWDFHHGWQYFVQVKRERAPTEETVTADAGPSRSYGYFSAIEKVDVSVAHSSKP